MPRYLLLGLVSLSVLLRALAAAQDPDYAITLLSVPGVVYTTAAAINVRGQIVGQYEVDPQLLGHGHGFLLDHGTFTTIDPPGATETFLTGINILGQIIGDYTDANHQTHGFLFRNGTFTTIDPPQATSTRLWPFSSKSDTRENGSQMRALMMGV